MNAWTILIVLIVAVSNLASLWSGAWLVWRAMHRQGAPSLFPEMIRAADKLPPDDKEPEEPDDGMLEDIEDQFENAR